VSTRDGKEASLLPLRGGPHPTGSAGIRVQPCLCVPCLCLPYLCVPCLCRARCARVCTAPPRDGALLNSWL
jgi:hypothetical protein